MEMRVDNREGRITGKYGEDRNEEWEQDDEKITKGGDF